MAIHRLNFDTTDALSIEQSSNVGAYVRMFDNGKLVSYSNVTEAGSLSFNFADGDVTVGTDSVNSTAHGLETGDIVSLSSSGTLPAGLSAQDYFVIRVDADNIKFASSLENAEAGTAVDITAAAGGGTHTAAQADREHNAMDVNIVNPVPITTDAPIEVNQGTDPWVIGDGGNSITVDAVDLDIRDLVFATDKVDVSGSEVSLDAATLAALETITVEQGTSPWVIGDGGGSLTVDAIDLDIRDLTSASDSVAAWLNDGTGNAIGSTAGSLDVNVTNSIDIDDGLANTAIATAANALDAANTAEDLVASPLANRKYLFAYNNGNKVAYVGPSGVSAANGFPIYPGGILEMRAGAAVDIEWVAANTNQEMRTLELS